MFNFEDKKDNNVMVPTKPSGGKENCALVEVERNTTDNSFIFKFVEKEGDKVKAVLNHRVFVPKKLDQMSDEEFKKSVELNVNGLAHIFRAFATEEEFNAIKVEDPKNLNKVEANWMSITKQMGGVLKAKISKGDDMSCALKVVYIKNKDKYYSGLPKVPSFISTKNHPKDFVINPQYDMLDIPAFSPDKERLATQDGAAKSAEPEAFKGAAADSGNSDF